jgi:transcription antitermination factor NusG
MKIGETVHITEGPFLGMDGLIIGSFQDRVVVTVVLESREIQMEIGRDWIAPVVARRSITRIENPKASQRKTG